MSWSTWRGCPSRSIIPGRVTPLIDAQMVQEHIVFMSWHPCAMLSWHERAMDSWISLPHNADIVNGRGFAGPSADAGLFRSGFTLTKFLRQGCIYPPRCKSNLIPLNQISPSVSSPPQE